MVDEKDLKELNAIGQRFKYNTATELDYNRYLDLIEKAGYKKEDIINLMKENGFVNWQSFKDARIEVKKHIEPYSWSGLYTPTHDFSVREKRRLEVELLGNILAYELAAGY